MTTGGDDEHNANGRVTLAVLGSKMDDLIQDMRELKTEQKEISKLVSNHDVIVGVHDQEIGKLRAQSFGWNVVNSLAIAVATWLGLKN